MQRGGSLEKTLMLGKIEGKRRGQAAEDEMVRQYHRFNRHEFEQTPRDTGGTEEAGIYSQWGHKELGIT